jgi:hypothetical protein
MSIWYILYYFVLSFLRGARKFSLHPFGCIRNVQKHSAPLSTPSWRRPTTWRYGFKAQDKTCNAAGCRVLWHIAFEKKKKHLKPLRFWLGKNQPETSMTLLYALDLSERIRNLYITNMTNDEVNPIINYPNNWPNGGHQMVDYGFTRLCVSLSKLISPMWKAHLQTNLVLSPWNSLTHQTTRNESWPNTRWSVSNHI